MKESHRKGLASHPDPESCGDGRKDMAEALTGAQVDWVLSREMKLNSGCRRRQAERKATRGQTQLASLSPTLRGHRPQPMLGNSMRENRETPAAPAENGGPEGESDER